MSKDKNKKLIFGFKMFEKNKKRQVRWNGVHKNLRNTVSYYFERCPVCNYSLQNEILIILIILIAI